jgi:hypothetical protein
VITLAVDPSINSIGAAIFAGREMTAVGRILVPTAQRQGCHGLRAELAAAQAIAWVGAQLASTGVMPDLVVYEWPQVYDDEKTGNKDRNDLPGLAAVGAAIVAHLREQAWRRQREVLVQTYYPAEWAHQTKKTIGERVDGKWRTRKPRVAETWLTARAKWIAKALTERERALAVAANHDAVDAVGIGLHHVGRLNELRVFPGATRG